MLAELVAGGGQANAHLGWSDFETMVDLIFTRSGCQRVSSLGGVQADVQAARQGPGPEQGATSGPP